MVPGWITQRGTSWAAFLGPRSTLQCASGTALSASPFIGLVVSAVEEFVPDVGETLPGSCATVWGLQPEQGGGNPSAGLSLCQGRREKSLLQALPQGQAEERRAPAEPCEWQNVVRSKHPQVIYG